MLKKRQIPKLRRTLFIERLEDRTLLAGNLTVGVNAGTLTITGDAGNVSQDFGIFPLGPGAVLVESATSTINGAAQPFAANNVNNIIATLFDGMDSATINQISITGYINITLGTGNDHLTVDNSMFGQLDAKVGREQDGAAGNITAEVNGNTVTGDHVNVSLLNQSGVSLKRLNLTQGVSPGSANTLALNNNAFTAVGKINVRIDDGTDTPSSSLRMNQNGNATHPTGGVRDVVGNGFGIVQTDQNFFGGHIESVGHGFVTLEATNNQILGSQSFTAGYDSHFQQPSVTISNENVGAGPNGGNLTYTGLGNINGNLQGLPWQLNNTTVSGSVALNLGDNNLARIDPTGISSRLDITMGSGGVNGLESLTMLGVASGDPNILFHSNAGDTVNIMFMNFVVTDPHALTYIRDYGRGKDLVQFDGVQIAGLFDVYLSNSGHNDVTAHNVKVHSGFIYGGGGMSHYHDQGGNSGYIVFGFA